MKVLHLFNEINHSGAELMYANASEYFRSNGIEMVAFSTGQKLGDYADEFKLKNIRIFHQPIQKKLTFAFKAIGYYIRFYRLLKEEKIDILHIHRSDLYLTGLVARFAGIRTVKTMHNVFRNRWFTYHYAVIKRYIARNLFKVTFQTVGRSVYENELNYYYNPTIRINNWYDENKFFPPRNSMEKNEVRKKYGIAENTFVVISIGGCSLIKNHFDIIKALSLLKNDIEYLYLHIGTGIEEKNEKKLAIELKISDNTKFLGIQQSLREFLVVADVHVMPSRFEGLSISALEAMACGLPSIFYNSHGLWDLINNNDNGFLIEHDYRLIAQKIVVLYNSPTLAKKMGNNARAFVLEQYSLNKNVSKILKLYKSLVS